MKWVSQLNGHAEYGGQDRLTSFGEDLTLPLKLIEISTLQNTDIHNNFLPLPCRLPF